jgi:transcriptional regulator with XRE-family HTH domain
MQKSSESYLKFIKGLGANIARIRTEKGLTLSQLAYKSDTEKVNIVRIEQSQTNPTARTLWKIAQALEVKTQDFFKGLD